MVSFACAAVLTAVFGVLVSFFLPPLRWPYPDRLAVIIQDEAGIDNVLPYNAPEKWARNGSQAGLYLLNPTRVGYFDKKMRATKTGPLRVVDMGCGGGLVSNALAQLEGYEAIEGVDLSLEALQFATATAAALPSGSARVNFQKASVYELPFPSGEFDAVVISDVLEHLLDLRSACKEAARVLKPGGVIVFDTIHRTPVSWIVSILGAEYIVRIIDKGSHDWRLFVQPSELQQALEEAGFSNFEHEAFQPSVRALLELSAFSAGLISADQMTGGFYIEAPSPMMVSYIGAAVKK